MYLILNKDAKMSTGKAAAQAAHAAVEAYIATPESNLKRVWHRGGHYTKIVLQAKDAHELQTMRDYIHLRGFGSVKIIDEGRTEVDPFTFTALGCCIVDKDNAHVAATFGEFSLYRDDPPAPAVELGTPKVSRVRAYLQK
jgi:PTH2 family peptidyl-tRNA hydrolase